MASIPKKSAGISAQRALHLGFIPLTDAAPLIVAHELGHFRRFGLQVELSREVGWATVRDKIVYRELDGSHAPAAVALSATLGLGSVPCECLTAFVFNLNGNAITLSDELWQRGVRDAKTMGQEILQCRGRKTYVFGVIFAQSSQRILFQDWLVSGGVNPDRDVRFVVVPPPQMFRNLMAGTLDGYSVGDPWNSLAVRERAGWCPALSMDLANAHPEKVFMVRKDFAEKRSAEHLAIVAALTEAAKLCDESSFRPELVKLLARREYLNLPERVLAAGLVGPIDRGHGQFSSAENFFVYHRQNANEPTPAKAEWLIDGLIRCGVFPSRAALPKDLVSRVFRTDLFHQANSSSNKPTNEIALHR